MNPSLSNTQWAHTWNSPSTNEDLPAGLAVDHLGNPYLAGYNESSQSFCKDGVLLGYSPGGTLLWTHIRDSGMDDFFLDLAINGTALYAAGTVHNATGGANAILCRFDLSGQSVWNVTTAFRTFYAATASDSAVYVAGLQHGGGLAVASFAANGTQLWAWEDSA